MRRLPLLTLSLFLALAGCDDGEGSDAGPPGDAGDGTRDAGPPFDAGPRMDGGGDDAGPGDSDAGPPPVDPCMGAGPPALDVENVASLSRPVFLTTAPGDVGALYVVEQAGTIQRIPPGGAPAEFMSITVFDPGISNERGLLGLAFHPDYATNGRFFVFYTPQSPSHNRVSEFARSAGDPNRGDPATEQVIFSEDDPEGNHNGGSLVFGPDGFLYAGVGDGGGGGDGHGPIGNGLNLDSPFGKIHRFDVDNMAGGYVAAGNPFVGMTGLDTIWAYGLRNPWRFSFDRATGDLWIGDVGQGAWEEIDFQPASSTGGENYGWRAYEGFEVFRGGNVSEVPVHAEPIHVYDRGQGQSVTGGYVYRGSAIPGLQGYYLFGDFGSTRVWALRNCPGGVDVNQVLSGADTGFQGPSSFGEDENGEMYIMGFGGGNTVSRIIAQ